MSSNSTTLSSDSSAALSACDAIAQDLEDLRTLEEWILGLVIALLVIALLSWALWCYGARLRHHKKNRKHGLIDAQAPVSGRAQSSYVSESSESSSY